MSNKELGMLLGVHIGDSLGATLEFKDARPYKDHMEILGGGSFQWRAGQATDDTDLTIAVLKSIKNGIFSEQICKDELIAWYQTNPKDIGNATRYGIECLLKGTKPDILEHGKGNGSLMRVSPLALLKLEEKELDQAVATQASLTHPHPDCVLVDQIYVKLLRLALNGTTKSEIFNEAIFLMRSNPMLTNRLYEIPTIVWDNLKTTGYCVDSLMCAIWAIYHCNSFEDALVQIVNRGDDADTSGAIAGGLCGAFYGLDQIPKRWVSKIERRDEIVSLYNLIWI